MVEQSSLLSHPVAIPFYKGEINHLFTVLQKNSIGMAYDGEIIAIARIHRDELEMDIFPNSEEFSTFGASQFFQEHPDTLFFKDNRFLNMVDWKNKKVISEFEDASKSIENNLEKSKIIDYQKGIALSLFYYFRDDTFDTKANCSFVIDDIINKKRLKEYAVPEVRSTDFPLFLTPSYVIFRTNYDKPWVVLDNDLNSTTFPLIDLLNTNEKDSIFFAFNNCMFISEQDKNALIISHNLAIQKDMLFLATWYGVPKVQPIEFDSSLLGDRRLVTYTHHNTMSPSGHWVYFCAQSNNNIDKDAHFLIYLDPRMPGGHLPPMRLGLEGTIGCAGWVGNPEGLVVYMNNQLLYYDLSTFDPRKMLEN